MSVKPFSADAAIRDRVAALDRAAGPAIRSAAAGYFAAAIPDPDRDDGGVLPACEVDALCGAHGIDADTLMLVLLQFAGSFARPPISNFPVGAVGAIGREAGTGNLVFGGKLEFTGAHIGNTVHGEGFVFTRAFSRGTAIETIAIGEAHPCAYSRQYLSKFAATSALRLIDPLGHRLAMAQLFPWPFDPNYLGEAGVVAGAVPHPELPLDDNSLSLETAQKLEAGGQRCHARYIKSPAALALTLRGGRTIVGAVIESAAFNPTMSPLQAAIIDLFAHGYGVADLASAVIAIQRGAAVDYAGPAVSLPAAIAPGVHRVEWA